MIRVLHYLEDLRLLSIVQVENKNCITLITLQFEKIHYLQYNIKDSWLNRHIEFHINEIVIVIKTELNEQFSILNDQL